jgi:Mg/Co/Ni transporter MgtE
VEPVSHAITIPAGDAAPRAAADKVLLSRQALRSSDALWREDSRGSMTSTSAALSLDEPDEQRESDTILANVGHRLPWLVSLMLVQSVSGYVVARYESLIQQHVIIASFLTMLVGGGGNSSGQTVAELVRRLRTGEITTDMFWHVLFKEAVTGLILSIGLGLAAFPRVRYLHLGATNMDAFAISLSYTLIIVMANTLAVCVTMLLHLIGRAAVGSPPVVQVLVDVLGISLSCVVCSALLE